MLAYRFAQPPYLSPRAVRGSHAMAILSQGGSIVERDPQNLYPQDFRRRASRSSSDRTPTAFRQPLPPPPRTPRSQTTRSTVQVNSPKAGNNSKQATRQPRPAPCPRHEYLWFRGFHTIYTTTAVNEYVTYLFQQRRVVRHRLLEGRRVARSVPPRHRTQKSGTIGDRRSDGTDAVRRGRVRDQSFSAEPEAAGGTREDVARGGSNNFREKLFPHQKLVCIHRSA